MRSNEGSQCLVCLTWKAEDYRPLQQHPWSNQTAVIMNHVATWHKMWVALYWTVPHQRIQFQSVLHSNFIFNGSNYVYPNYINDHILHSTTDNTLTDQWHWIHCKKISLSTCPWSSALRISLLFYWCLHALTTINGNYRTSSVNRKCLVKLC